jgi:hypothetical protein
MNQNYDAGETLVAAAEALRRLWNLRHQRPFDHLHTKEAMIIQRAAELEMMISGFLAEQERGGQEK